MIPMDREVDELAEVYSPQQLKEKYKVTQELMYLLALQKVQSDMKAAQNQLTMSQQQQPGTIKDQMEGQVFQEKLRQVSGTIAQQEAQRRQQQPQQPRPQQRMMASGGIVGFSRGQGVKAEYQPTEEEIQTYLDSLPERRGGRSGRPPSRQSAINAIRQQTVEEEKQAMLSQVKGGRSGQRTPTPPVITAAEKQTELDAIRAEEPDLAGLAGIEADKLTAEQLQQKKPPATTPNTGGAGIASVAPAASSSTEFKSVMEVLPEELKSSLTSMAGMGAEGIAAAGETDRLRAEEVAGRADKAQKFERMRQEQETLYNELQDPDKQQAQMRRNIFAAFGRGGNSFGQLMGNALTAISETEAGQDQLKQLALSKKQGVDTLAMEVDVKIADQTNQSINAAINAAKADRRQAMDTLSKLTAEDVRQNRQFARDQFDFQSDKATQAFRRADLLSRQLDRQVSRDVTELTTITSAINNIRETRAEALATVLSTNQKYLTLETLRQQGKLDEEEAEELNLLKKSAEKEVYEKLGASDEILQRLTEQADAIRSRREVSVDQIMSVS